MPQPLELKLYRISTAKLKPLSKWPDSLIGFKLVIYKPDIFSLGKFGFHPLRNLFWYVVTGGSVKILLLFDKDVLIHSFYISKKTYRYGYMTRKDINLGQATTIPAYQGRGILTNVLKLIFSYYAGRAEFVYTYCHVDNIAPQKANERAGMEFISYAKMSRMTRIVRTVQN